jgi:hypothetical protein
MISLKFAPLPDHDVWHAHERHENDLVSLMPAPQVIVGETLAIFGQFAEALKGKIGYPVLLVSRMRLFVRLYFIDRLQEAQKQPYLGD